MTSSPGLVAGGDDLFPVACSAAIDYRSSLTREAPPLLDDSAPDVLRALGDGALSPTRSPRPGC